MMPRTVSTSHPRTTFWVAQAPSPLEELEKLEQLRPLGSGARIGVAVVGAADPGVDTPADVVKTEEKLQELTMPRPSTGEK